MTTVQSIARPVTPAVVSWLVYPASSDAVEVKSVFEDIWVSWHETATRRYLAMELRGGLQRFSCDVSPNAHGLKRCRSVATAMGLALYITPDALAAMRDF